jgi:phospholipase/carboxylesterase
MVHDAERGRLSTRRPVADGHAGPRLGAGTGELPLGPAGRAWVRVPTGATGARPLPLVVALHGAGGRAPGMLTMLAEPADRHGLLVVAPQSAASSWDVIQGRYGPDVRLVDAALGQVLNHHAVDPDHLAVSGFSDGASYALSLGIANGDLFGHVMAWSPGFAAAQVNHGRPRFFLSHGTRDRVLPVDRCSRRLVPSLRSAGYDVVYDEFDGAHAVPPDVLERSVRWFLDGAEDGS